jgi:type I restriction enzyme S subunit
LVAACALVRETPPRLLMSDLMFRFRLRPDAKLDSTFLQQLLIYPTKRREIQKFAGGSAGSMPNISKARLKKTPIEVPPIPLQREFARRVTAVEALKTAQRASLAELDALFATLQHRAFRGEL